MFCSRLSNTAAYWRCACHRSSAARYLSSFVKGAVVKQEGASDDDDKDDDADDGIGMVPRCNCFSNTGNYLTPHKFMLKAYRFLGYL